MNFDLISMKQRAKILVSQKNLNLKSIGFIFAILTLIYYVVLYYSMSKQMLIVFPILEIIYVFFRTCLNWYTIDISREKPTTINNTLNLLKNNAVKVFFVSLIKEILCFIGFCFFGIGMIIPYYCFRFSTYVVKDENVSIFQALAISKKMLKGHWGDLFKLDLSNIGWFILILFTYGIGGFYAKPYTAITYAEFYDFIMADYKSKY